MLGVQHKEGDKKRNRTNWKIDTAFRLDAKRAHTQVWQISNVEGKYRDQRPWKTDYAIRLDAERARSQV